MWWTKSLYRKGGPTVPALCTGFWLNQLDAGYRSGPSVVQTLFRVWPHHTRASVRVTGPLLDKAALLASHLGVKSTHVPTPSESACANYQPSFMENTEKTEKQLSLIAAFHNGLVQLQKNENVFIPQFKDCTGFEVSTKVFWELLCWFLVKTLYQAEINGRVDTPWRVFFILDQDV